MPYRKIWINGKQFDTYKVSTVANSTSTMHKIQSKPITLESFETDDAVLTFTLFENEPYNYDDIMRDWVDTVISGLETLRQKYLETKDKKYWKELIRWLPEGWLQKRTVTLNYETLLAICSKSQRRFHKLNEWSGQDKPEVQNFIAWARKLPYAQDFIFIDEEEKNDE